ncbi:hypothetical protein HHI36_021286 [Cryptolaemus montrouzieri]|uniref:RPGRIP1 C-terminal domain-containing protein n=1 Tax=Cryptolaemus montrouzieri TaxID=559131 RepID=A0ABD2MX73_9CUCU
MTEIDNIKNYNAIPILKVCPGKLTKTLRNQQITNLEEKTIIRKSFFTPVNLEQGLLQQEKKRKAHFELGIVSLKLAQVGRELLENNEENLEISWQLMEFPESTVTPTVIENGRTEFQLSVLYKIDECEKFLFYLENENLIFNAVVGRDDAYIKMGCGELSLSRALNQPKTRVYDEVELYYSIEERDKPILLATLDVWYLLDFTRRTMVTLNALLEQTSSKNEDFAYKSTSLSSHLMAEKFRKTKDTLLSSSSVCTFNALDVEVTEEEVKNFQEALFLVLNRNKALRITQSEVSRELRDRAEWLNEEAVWRRTLQEYAILSGKNPYNVQWRQWRDDVTSKVTPRAFPTHPTSHEPILDITICDVSFFPHATPYQNDDIKQIYVEYFFLDMDGPEMESEKSLPMPPPNEPATFNFHKTYGIDLKKDRKNCQFIAEMIEDRTPLRVSIVSEPLTNIDMPIQTCTEIGYAEMDFFQLVQFENNEEQIDYKILDKNTKENIGTMKIRVDGILAMRKMALLVLAPKDYDMIV